MPSTTAQIPLYVETHRATVTQDIWRTLQLVKRFPEIRFNGDSRTGTRATTCPSATSTPSSTLLAPVLERTRYLHGRIGTGGIIQVDVGDGTDEDVSTLAHFRPCGPGSFAGFIATAAADPVPLAGRRDRLRPRATHRGVRLRRPGPDADGELRGVGDRWEQALVLTRIAAECFTAAAETNGSSGQAA